MKNIAIFCDGTWQNLDQANPTNVARLARMAGAPGGEVQQIVRYDDGVGVGQGVADRIQGLLGGALGKGLDYKIARSYQFLALNYEPGDRIFLFGFSRGAYTVRSLAGLLRQMWILRPDAAGKVKEAVDLYRERPHSTASSKIIAAWVAEIRHFNKLWCRPNDDAFLGEKAYTPNDPKSLEPDNTKTCAWIQYLGVWDTVGSLGVPDGLPFADKLDAKYDFHDVELSRFVRSARHAVALDERRETFAPSLWGNIDLLNANAKAQALAYGQRPYQQQWFPGGHGAVGGGGASPASLAPMLWIAEGAARAGLKLDWAQIKAFEQKVDPEADFDQERFDLGGVVLRLGGTKWRDAPESLDEISLAAKVRIQRLKTYDPHSMLDATVAKVKAASLPAQLTWFAP